MTGAAVGERYRLERVLGRGGMAVVHEAEDTELGRRVAIKILAPHAADDAAVREWFGREARVAAQLAHPNLVRVYDFGEHDGCPFIVMELVRGEPLDRLLARRGRLRVAEAVDLVHQSCAGLAHAHDAGLVHRDVKPHNLLVRDDGVVKVADFGIARVRDLQRLTEAGTVLGTAAYFAPEQARGEDVTPAADVYSLGVVLYELLCGHAPTRTALAPREAIAPLRDLVPDVPPELELLVARCLDEDPAARPATAADLAHELAAAVPAEAATVPLARPPAIRVSSRRRARAAGWVAAALLVVGGAAAIAATHEGSPPPPPKPPARGQTPAEEARNLATWLRDASG